MKPEQNDPVPVNPPRSGPLLLAGVLMVMASLACLLLYTGRLSAPPQRAAIPPPTAAQPSAHTGFVCRSPHFNLTAEIHAGS